MARPTHALNRLSTHGSVECVGAVVVAGPDRGASAVTSDASAIGIGSADGNTLTLSDETVSRYHLELTGSDAGIRVLDLGSTNGTRVGDTLIERGTVPPNTVLSLGNTKVRVTRAEDAIVVLHPKDGLSGLRGRSVAMRRVMAQVERLAPTDAAILLVGESGTGKELVAQALHERSARAEAPFVTVDCAALTESLVTSELFGHERGAFTGADRMHRGVFERAHGGTVFLDEIGELPPTVQSNLLGVLERRRLRRVGGAEDIDIDVRVLSATNRDLRSEVNHGRFRLDLYYRLSVVCIPLPPLRERAEDIPLLLQHFLEECGCTDPIATYFSPARMEELERHAWPGNVRELRNVVEAALAMGSPNHSLPPPMMAPPTSSPPELDFATESPFKEARAALVHAFERRYLTALIERTEGNVSEAARQSCITRSHLFKMLKRHGLK